MNIKIIVASHKPYEMPSDTIYVPLQVGAAGKTGFGFERDDTGENISEKNPYYCELTGLYWAWKNLEAEYIGLAHYRRHFCGKCKSSNKMERVIRGVEVEGLLQKAKVIVPQKRKYYIESLYSHYAHTHYGEHLELVNEIVSKQCPEYLQAYRNVLQQTEGYMFNMMIMEKSLLNQYCQWLFPILGELEAQVNLDDLSDFQKRLFGRVSEILLNVWLAYQLETKNILPKELCEVPYIHMEKTNWFKKGTSFLKAKFFGNKYDKSF